MNNNFSYYQNPHQFRRRHCESQQQYIIGPQAEDTTEDPSGGRSMPQRDIPLTPEEKSKLRKENLLFRLKRLLDDYSPSLPGRPKNTLEMTPEEEQDLFKHQKDLRKDNYDEDKLRKKLDELEKKYPPKPKRYGGPKREPPAGQGYNA